MKLVDTSTVPEEPKSVQQVVSELKELTVTYAKQETVDPVKGLGKFIAFGIAGSLMLGVGLVLWALAGLRALQTETGDTFDGAWSWAPYLLTLLLCAAVAGAAGMAATRRRRAR